MHSLGQDWLEIKAKNFLVKYLKDLIQFFHSHSLEDCGEEVEHLRSIMIDLRRIEPLPVDFKAAVDSLSSKNSLSYLLFKTFEHLLPNMIYQFIGGIHQLELFPLQKKGRLGKTILLILCAP
ncbi:uncharacterized protein LOC124444219 [Xenia sp. Carnegie-2017]|uniref:uncharacterized protein LOC124444219 n=1 Tax=Xenia sp. Carnegie-2017 TaxID=2897299 RepID=UPI001F047F5B|nr:uncharacterized protein LOC124444219 [Xenia sp. Carnegie-2017]